MIIAVDYDRTYDSDPLMFEQILNLMRVRGHEVIICTMRYDSGWEADELHYVFKDTDYTVYFTGRLAKKKFLEDRNIKVDIWIDDHPQYIHFDYMDWHEDPWGEKK